MIVFNTVNDINEGIQDPIFAIIGNFDGVHKGHVNLLNDIKKEKSFATEKILVITFAPHPEMIIHSKNHYLISSQDEKYKLLREAGVDYIFEINFTDELRNLNPDKFFQDFILSMKNLKKFFMGEDFSLGKDKCFGISNAKELLAKNNIETQVLQKILINDEVVSSTQIRKLILESRFAEATNLLGHPFSIEAKIFKGKQIGRTLGIPTANLIVNSDLIYPTVGVYSVKVEYRNKLYLGVMNVGLNPTTIVCDRLKLEVHILDFSENLYSEHIKVYPVQRIRDEKKFENLELLALQIKKDIQVAKSTLVNCSFV